jgi:hypothetical protein
LQPFAFVLFFGLFWLPMPVQIGCAPGNETRETTRDLTPYARLVASDTHADGWWFREAEDAIATVRDDRPETGWAVPIGRPSWVEVDLLPWPGRPVRLDRLTASFAGEAPSEASVVLGHACGMPPTATLPWPDLTEPLDLGGRAAGCVRMELTTSDAMRLHRLELSAAEDLVVPDEVPRSPAEVLDPDSGVIEGFYGIPWSWRERRRMMAAQASLGMGLYLYAPKNDPLHRDRWRDPYPEADIARFAALADHARALGVTAVIGVSPFIDYRDDEADYATLVEKVRAFLDLGFGGFAVLADDIEFAPGVEVDGALGTVHVAVVNRLATDLADAIPYFTPTVYSDERATDWSGGMAYLTALQDLDPRIKVLWTGPGTGNRTLAASDMTAFTATTGHKPLIWDNFWANDGGDGLFGRLMLGPYDGRHADLKDAVLGIAQNLSIQGASSRLALATAAAWQADPTGSPGERRDAAVGLEVAFATGAMRSTEADRDFLLWMMRAFDGHSQDDPPHHRDLEAGVAALAAALSEGITPARDAVRDLLPVLGRMVGSQSEAYHSGLDPDLIDDWWWPLQRLVQDGRTGLWALSELGERFAGRDGSEALAHTDEAALAAASCRFIVSPGAIPALREAVGGTSPTNTGFQLPAPRDPPPSTCRADQEARFRPFDGGGDLRVFGLPGAVVADGEIVWTPPRGGRYHGVVTLTTAPQDPPGWTFLEFDVACAR